MSKPLVIKSMDQLRRSLARAGKNRVYWAFKYARFDGRSPYFPHRSPVLRTRVGAVLKVKNANVNPKQGCGRGVSVGTRVFCLEGGRSYFSGPFPTYNLFVVEFRKRDVACVPKRSEGKWRLFRCKVIKRIKVR